MERKYIYLVFFCLALAIGVGIYAAYKDSKSPKKNLTTEITPTNLTAKEIRKLEEDLIRADKDIELRTDPNNKYEAYVDKGEILFKLGKLSLAASSLKEALKLFPERAKAYSILFDVQIAMNDLAAARETIRTLVEANSSTIYWRQYIAFEQDKMNSPPEQIDALYNQALVKTDNNIGIVTDYARFLEKTGDIEKAKEYWRRAGEIDPNDKSKYDAEIQRLGADMPPSQ
jgi:tetratricopeptide (TPR) repeat protein